MVAKERMKAPIPERAQFERTPGGFVLTYPWSRTSGLMQIGGVVAMAAFLYFLFRKELSTGTASWILPVVGVFMIGQLYGALAALVNRTRVGLGDGRLFVRHHPLPWRGSQALEARDIARVSVEMVTPRFRMNDSSNSPRPELRAVLRDGRQVRLLAAPQDVLTLVEEELRERLGLVAANESGRPPGTMG